MKHINFIDPVPQKRKNEVRRWFLTTTLFLGGFIFSMFFLFGTQLYFLMRIRSDCQGKFGCTLDDTMLKRHQALLDERKQFELYQKKQANWVNKTGRKIEILSALHAQLPKGVQIEAIHIQKRAIEVLCLAPHALNIQATLSQIHRKTGVVFHVDSLATRDSTYSFTARGAL